MALSDPIKLEGDDAKRFVKDLKTPKADAKRAAFLKEAERRFGGKSQ